MSIQISPWLLGGLLVGAFFIWIVYKYNKDKDNNEEL